MFPASPATSPVYLGGSIYYQRIADMADQGYEGFAFEQAQPSAVAGKS